MKRYPHPSRLFFFSLHLFNKVLLHQHITSTQLYFLLLSLFVSPFLLQEPNYEFFPGSGSGAGDDVTHNVINVPLNPMWTDTSISSSSNAATAAIAMNTRRGAAASSASVAGLHTGAAAFSAGGAGTAVPAPILCKPTQAAAAVPTVGREAYRQAVLQVIPPPVSQTVSHTHNTFLPHHVLISNHCRHSFVNSVWCRLCVLSTRRSSCCPRGSTAWTETWATAARPGTDSGARRAWICRCRTSSGSPQR